jgi:hypothetical protein
LQDGVATVDVEVEVRMADSGTAVVLVRAAALEVEADKRMKKIMGCAFMVPFDLMMTERMNF